MDNFKSLTSLVNEYLEGYTNLTSKTIQGRIQKAYEEDAIDGSGYDYLMGMMLE